MPDSVVVVVAVAITWTLIGVLLSVVMGRRGHNSFGWLVSGAVLGPLAVVLAAEARRSAERLDPHSLRLARPSPAGEGPVDVLLGYDGSEESLAALDAVSDLLGERLGRLTAATVVAFGEPPEFERRAKERLTSLDARDGRARDLEILHGHPAAALSQYAAEGGYGLIAVGARGSGVTKAILGSAASQLARDSKVPVLLVGGTSSDRARPASIASGNRRPVDDA